MLQRILRYPGIAFFYPGGFYGVPLLPQIEYAGAGAVAFETPHDIERGKFVATFQGGKYLFFLTVDVFELNFCLHDGGGLI
jgi:hypothetical protein